ncbi:MAG: hypothetical protein PHX80_04555 [Candidatus Nanoarchaeia archaeon]|nr:hypothetical protein [Candidatus Nanoarchaeia archaeon]
MTKQKMILLPIEEYDELIRIKKLVDEKLDAVLIDEQAVTHHKHGCMVYQYGVKLKYASEQEAIKLLSERLESSRSQLESNINLLQKLTSQMEAQQVIINSFRTMSRRQIRMWVRSQKRMHKNDQKNAN